MINLAEHYNLDLFTFLVEALEKLLTKIKYYIHSKHSEEYSMYSWRYIKYMMQ
jgi:hypothetical protein